MRINSLTINYKIETLTNKPKLYIFKKCKGGHRPFIPNFLGIEYKNIQVYK